MLSKGPALCAIQGKPIRRTIFCWHFLFVLCLIKAASYVRIFKKNLSGLSAGPFDGMFDVIDKWRKMCLPLMFYADLNTFDTLLKFVVCVI